MAALQFLLEQLNGLCTRFRQPVETRRRPLGCNFADNLPERIERVSDDALRTGALQPIAARSEEVEEQGVRFVIHLLDE